MAEVHFESQPDAQELQDLILAYLNHRAAYARTLPEQPTDEDRQAQDDEYFHITKDLVNFAHFAPTDGLKVDDVYQAARNYAEYPDLSLLLSEFDDRHPNLLNIWRGNSRRIRNRFALLDLLVGALGFRITQGFTKPTEDSAVAEEGTWGYARATILRKAQRLGFDYQAFREVAENNPRVNDRFPRLTF